MHTDKHRWGPLDPLNSSAFGAFLMGLGQRTTLLRWLVCGEAWIVGVLFGFFFRSTQGSFTALILGDERLVASQLGLGQHRLVALLSTLFRYRTRALSVLRKEPQMHTDKHRWEPLDPLNGFAFGAFLMGLGQRTTLLRWLVCGEAWIVGVLFGFFFRSTQGSFTALILGDERLVASQLGLGQHRLVALLSTLSPYRTRALSVLRKEPSSSVTKALSSLS